MLGMLRLPLLLAVLVAQMKQESLFDFMGRGRPFIVRRRLFLVLPAVMWESDAAWSIAASGTTCLQHCVDSGASCSDATMQLRNEDVDSSAEVLVLISALGGSTSAVSCSSSNGFNSPNFKSGSCNYKTAASSAARFQCGGSAPPNGRQRLCFCTLPPPSPSPPPPSPSPPPTSPSPPPPSPSPPPPSPAGGGIGSGGSSGGGSGGVSGGVSSGEGEEADDSSGRGVGGETQVRSRSNATYMYMYIYIYIYMYMHMHMYMYMYISPQPVQWGQRVHKYIST